MKWGCVNMTKYSSSISIFSFTSLIEDSWYRRIQNLFLFWHIDYLKSESKALDDGSIRSWKHFENYMETHISHEKLRIWIDLCHSWFSDHPEQIWKEWLKYFYFTNCFFSFQLITVFFMSSLTKAMVIQSFKIFRSFIRKRFLWSWYV